MMQVIATREGEPGVAFGFMRVNPEGSIRDGVVKLYLSEDGETMVACLLLGESKPRNLISEPMATMLPEYQRWNSRRESGHPGNTLGDITGEWVLSYCGVRYWFEDVVRKYLAL